MPPDKDDKDDTITDNTDSYKPINLPLNDVNTDKTCIKYKTNKVSDINRHTYEPAAVFHVNENHIDKQKKPKKKIQFSSDVRVKDSPNHSYTLDELSDKQESNEMDVTIEDDDQKSIVDNEPNGTKVSRVCSFVCVYTCCVL